MQLQSLFKFNHEVIKKFIGRNSIIIDATCGNGHDTKYLANIANKGHVYTFDIQQIALNNAQKTCIDLKNITFINDGHENLDNYVDDKIDLVIFNLGYLPNYDQTITTTANTTIIAITKAMKLLKKSGCIIITIYTEHDNYLEANEIEKYVRTINKYEYSVLKYQFLNLNHNPYSIFIEKK